jgi:hypothetical protein
MSRPGRNTPGRGTAAQHGWRRQESPAARPRKLIWLATTVVAIAIGFVAGKRVRLPEAPLPSPPAQPTAPVLPKSHYELLAMSPAELGKVDIAIVNLLCAQGLPGAEKLDIPAALKRLDEWAAKVKFHTQRHLYRVNDPRYADHYAHSEARLKAEFIVQCLQEDCGVHYNVNRIDTPDFSNSQDMFLHGMIDSTNGGTCASMPVMYVAIGRRLGYPMKLALAKQHVFCRWDDGKEMINIEGATNGGVSYYDDDHYRKWPTPITDEEMASGEFLKSLNPQEEMAAFLLNRAMCMLANHRPNDARASLTEGLVLMPNSPTLRGALGSTMIFEPQVQTARRPSGQYVPSLSPQVRAMMPPDPADPTPRIPMPGANPAFAIPNQPLGRPR